MNEQKVSSLVEELTCNDVIKCQKARRSLVAVGHQAVPSLVKALKSKKEWVRWEAAKALGQIGDPAAIGALIDALQDEMFDVRWLAAEGLIGIGPRSLVPLLYKLTEQPDSLFLREGAHHVLSEINREDIKSITQPILRALEDIEAPVEVSLAAQAALKSLK
jgi:HEAT repeat protein